MSNAAHPKPTGALDGTDLGDEYLFYDRDKDRVHVLNSTAREIFLLCDGRRSEEDIARALGEAHALDDTTACQDTRAALEQLRDLGLISR